MTAKRQMKFGAFLHPTGHNAASWRHPDAPLDAAFRFDNYVHLARIAERGKFDLLFIADGAAVRSFPERSNQYVAIFEPLTLLSALSAVTRHIGLVGTMSTTYNEPFHVARKFASLDLLSGGRAGWNLVTSADPQEAMNYSRDEHMEHDERYRRAMEFAEVAIGLWDSWEHDAFVQDKASGLYADTRKMHALNHQGKYFKVKGPLNAARSPQGRPVIVQAGSSDAGKDCAAKYGEAVFTSQPTLDKAKAFYRDLKDRAGSFGRAPDEVKILPGVSPVVGKTREEAKEKFDFIQSLLTVEAAVAQLSHMLNFDMTRFPVDGPMPDLPETNAGRSFREIAYDLARTGLTLGQIALRTAAARSHGVILGSVKDVCDQLEDWFVSEACDGFNVMPQYFPGGLEDFVDLVIPELQRRGLFREKYEGATLRENLGLKIPENRYSRG